MRPVGYAEGTLFLERHSAVEFFRRNLSCCEHHKQNSIHLHCIGVAAKTDISKLKTTHWWLFWHICPLLTSSHVHQSAAGAQFSSLLTCWRHVGSLFTETIKSNMCKTGSYLTVAHLSGFILDLYAGGEDLANICQLAFCHCPLLTSRQSGQSLLIYWALALLFTNMIV